MPSLLFYLLLGRSIKSGEVTLHSDSKPISVFCHMGDFGCGDGGWTPIMKINGNKVTIYPRRNSLLKKDSGEKRQRGWAKSAAASLMKRQGSSRVARLSSLREAWNMLLLRSYRKWTCKFYSFLQISGYIPLRFPVLEGQKCLQPSRRQDCLWLTRDKVTNLLDHTLLQNLSRYEDRQSAQIHCHQPAGGLSPLSYNWWKIPQHLKGSWHVENTDWLTSLIAALLQ